jgi:hypothetical protein
MYNGTDRDSFPLGFYRDQANPTDFFLGFSSTLTPSTFPFLSCFFSFASFIMANFASRCLVSFDTSSTGSSLQELYCPAFSSHASLSFYLY